MSKLNLNNVRLAFPALWEPKAFDENSDEKYQANLLIPKDSKQVADINRVIKEVAMEKWGAKADSILKTLQGNNMKYCFLDGDDRSDSDGFAGNFFLNAKSKSRPLVIDRNKSPLTAADGRPYGGCYVNANVEIYAQDHKTYGKGIRCQLRGIQFYRDGDAFSGGAPASEEEFQDLSEEANEDLA